jgi:hypothetical protein
MHPAAEVYVVFPARRVDGLSKKGMMDDEAWWRAAETRPHWRESLISQSTPQRASHWLADMFVLGPPSRRRPNCEVARSV